MNVFVAYFNQMGRPGCGEVRVTGEIRREGK